MESNHPADDPDSIWKSHPAFDAWIRGHLRRGWSRYPLRGAKLRNARFRAPIGRFGKNIWAVRCNICGETFPQSKVQVDHIIEAGSLRQEGGLDGFIERLFPNQEGMQILCHPCHTIKTLSVKRGISFEEAVIEKQVIKIMNYPASAQIAWLEEKGITDDKAIKNTKTRTHAVRCRLNTSARAQSTHRP
jgi:hypothetical protein